MELLETSGNVSERDYWLLPLTVKLQQPVPLALDVVLVPDLPIGSVVGHLPILDADGAYFVRPFASADLLFSVLGSRRSRRLLPRRENTSPKKLQRKD